MFVSSSKSLVYFSLDVEADGPAPPKYSMVSLGLVRLDTKLETTFYAELRPITDDYEPEALSVCRFTREQTLAFPIAEKGILDLVKWLVDATGGREARLISDNPMFDCMWLNYYCMLFLGKLLFGHSAHRIGDFDNGLNRTFAGPQKWKNLRPEGLQHHALADAKADAVALLQLAEQQDLALPLYPL